MAFEVWTASYPFRLLKTFDNAADAIRYSCANKRRRKNTKAYICVTFDKDVTVRYVIDTKGEL